MSDPWKFIYDQTGFDPQDKYARKEKLKRTSNEHHREESEEGSRWEYCEIHCKYAGFLGLKSYFWAQAVGGTGVSSAARSTQTFNAQGPSLGEGSPDSDDPKAKKALDELIAALSAEGWEPTGRGGEWYEYTLRRRVR